MICVDQLSVRERRYQVKRFADIYEPENTIAVYLGPDSATVPVLSLVNDLGAESRLTGLLDTIEPFPHDTDSS